MVRARLTRAIAARESMATREFIASNKDRAYNHATTAERTVVFDSIKSEFESLESFPLSNGKQVEFAQIHLPKRHCVFLRDSRSTVSGGAIYFYAFNPSQILRSIDDGASWKPIIDLPVPAKIVGFCELKNGYLVQRGTELSTELYSLQGQLIRSFDTPKFAWHGSQGISVSPDGTCLFSEYQTGFEHENIELSVWKLTSGDSRLEAKLTQKVGPKPPIGDIRHFHTCFHDPFISQRWYCSSGDVSTHNKLWKSDDDGETWTELRPTLRNASEYGVRRVERALRFTSAVVTGPGRLAYATDDNLGIGSAAFVIAEVSDDDIHLNITSLLSRNLARSVIRHEQGFVVIAESKHDLNQINIDNVDLQGIVRDRIALANLKNAKCPVTQSISSGQFVRGTAFIPSRGSILTRNHKSPLVLKLVET